MVTVAENMEKVFAAGARSGGADWNANKGEAGYVANRTHYVDKNGEYHQLDPRFIPDECRADKLPMFDLSFETTDGELKYYKVYGFEVEI